MSKVIQKNSGFVLWVCLPSLLLVTLIFSINFFSRPGLTEVGTACTTSADCNGTDGASRSNACITEDCVDSACALSSHDSSNSSRCGADTCGDCGNGVCESFVQDATNCPTDCLINNINVCPIATLETRYAAINDKGCSGSIQDFCCPAGCTVGTADSGTQDADCLCGLEEQGSSLFGCSSILPPPLVAPVVTTQSLLLKVFQGIGAFAIPGLSFLGFRRFKKRRKSKPL